MIEDQVNQLDAPMNQLKEGESVTQCFIRPFIYIVDGLLPIKI